MPRTRTKVPIGVERNLTVNMLPGTRKLYGTSEDYVGWPIREADRKNVDR